MGLTEEKAHKMLAVMAVFRINCNIIVIYLLLE
jgi:hypothetical protein